MKSVIIKIGVAVVIGGIFFIAASSALCWWIGIEKCRHIVESHPPWILFSAFATVPGVVLTWYWRHMNNTERLITERFAKATEMLGSEKLEQRLGAIYQLERIAEDSPRDHWTVMETLCAFVRERCNWTDEKEKIFSENQKAKVKQYGEHKPGTDIQAALTVVGRRTHLSTEKNCQLNLATADLRGADMHDGNFSEISLLFSHLEFSSFKSAILRRADFRAAHFTNTDFTLCHGEEGIFSVGQYTEACFKNAFLKGAMFNGSGLSNTNFQNADLRGVNFNIANMEFTYLDGADVDGASFQKTHLENARLCNVDLSKSKFLDTAFLEKAKYDENTIFPCNFNPNRYGMVYINNNPFPFLENTR